VARGKAAQVGDERISPNGYHYTREPQGWELTGRLVAGKARGKPLAKNERVRYTDGNRLNNDPSNLVVYQVKEQSASNQLERLYSKRDEIQAQIDDLEREARS
jgi:hypothetical protein